VAIVTPPVVREALGGGVTALFLSRPARRNVIDGVFRLSLYEELQHALADDATRAIVIAGHGGVFCGGGDLDAMVGVDAVAAHRRMDEAHRVVRALITARKPIVAAVDGWAVGGGAGLALACDTVLAARGARFSFPFTGLGLVPDWGLAMTLPQRVGAARARQILLYDAVIEAAEAEQLGLIDEAVDANDLLEAAARRGRELAAKAPFSLAGVKQLLTDGQLDRLLAEEAALQALCLVGDEAAARRAAFLEKRRLRAAGGGAR
jgi:enoyl-CoA hydratase/carnithine racemase